MDATIYRNREGTDALAIRIPEGGEGIVLEPLTGDPVLMEPTEAARLAVNLSMHAREAFPETFEHEQRKAAEEMVRTGHAVEEPAEAGQRD